MGTDLDLNNPQVRQGILLEHVQTGEVLVTAKLCEELGVSIATIRRDLAALEEQGKIERVRGGAIAVRPPSPSYAQRSRGATPHAFAVQQIWAPFLSANNVILADGGRAVLEFMRAMPALPGLMIITPAPAIALLGLERGIETLLIGGRLSDKGAISVGAAAERELQNVATDLCIMGTCALDVECGASSDDYDEASMRRQMFAVSTRTIVLAQKDKLGTRARHAVAPLDKITALVTDAAPSTCTPFLNQGVHLEYV
ncbi:DeoR/GlpR family DNA-binding transcription regulator [Polycladidibacter hongkongensis]|uniref:DeoR/GlpR family DNA-binding transcription regulator n=1 Tax=Polycladidibacter hongkongensis TaxID=1647556 RepID=UPI00082C8C20|nr:DeoR/GlpR family DNA-binding transcription regulator [Pseudovibrio hongkongensis]